MNFDAVFFDFGGVILTSPFDAFAAYEHGAGLPPGAIRAINSTRPDHNAWARFERNEIGLVDFVGAFEREAEEMGFVVSALEVLGCLEGHVRPEMVEAVRSCSERLITALLTNNVSAMSASGLASHEGADRPTDRFSDVVRHFDHIVESSAIGVRKPEPRFYEIACELAGVAPGRVVFLDDLGVNLKPARSMGMTTIKVADPGVALDELSRLVGFALGGPDDQWKSRQSRSESGENADVRISRCS